MKKMFIKPAHGAKYVVFHPGCKQTLRLAGQMVPKSAYWVRAQLQGTVIETEPPSIPVDMAAAENSIPTVT